MITARSVPAASSRTPAAGVAAALVVLLGGCAADPPPPPPPVPTFAATTSSSPTVSTSTAPRFPESCGNLISTRDVDLAVGQPVVGRVRSIVGVPEPKIKRLARLTCQYGLPEQPPPAGAPPAPVPLEISVSRYADDASATERMTATIESERARGAAPTTVPVAGATGTVLVTSERRMLVASTGTTTLAITLLPGLADDRTAEVLSELGGRVLIAVT